jgi:hypothetical protein
MNEWRCCHSTQRYREELLSNELSCLSSDESMHICSGHSHMLITLQLTQQMMGTYRLQGQHYNSQCVSTSTRNGHVWSTLGQNAARHRTPSILANSKERNGVLYKTDLSWWGKPVPKKISPPLTILTRFKNIYICKPMSNSMTGHHTRLIWAPSRICEQVWREL